MTYICFFYLTVEPGKEQNVIEYLRKENEKLQKMRKEELTLGNYEDIEYFSPFMAPTEGVLVWAELSSRAGVPSFWAYLKTREYVKQIVNRELSYYPSRGQ